MLPGYPAGGPPVKQQPRSKDVPLSVVRREVVGSDVLTNHAVGAARRSAWYSGDISVLKSIVSRACTGYA